MGWLNAVHGQRQPPPEPTTDNDTHCASQPSRNLQSSKADQTQLMSKILTSTHVIQQLTHIKKKNPPTAPHDVHLSSPSPSPPSSPSPSLSSLQTQTASTTKQGTAKNSRSTTTNNEQPTNKQRTMNGDQRNGQTTTKEQRTTTNNDEGRRTKDDEGRRTTKDEGRRTTNDELKFCVVIHSSFVVRSFVRSFVCSKERH